MRTRVCVLAALAAAATLPLLPETATAAKCVNGTVTPAAEADMLNQINERRSTAGVRPLKGSPRLTAAGRKSARSMARTGDFQHDGFWWARGRAVAQNIAMAPEVTRAVTAMMRSAPHRRNILNTRLNRAGVGAARDCSGQIYFTLNLSS